MGIEVLLDSVIVIDQLNGSLRAEAYIKDVRSRAAVSVVTRAEVLVGYSDAEWSVAANVLDSFPILAVSSEIADAAARIRRDYRSLKLPDAFQAALAQHHRLRLATRNTRDFPEQRFPFVVVPYQL